MFLFNSVKQEDKVTTANNCVRMTTSCQRPKESLQVKFFISKLQQFTEVREGNPNKKTNALVIQY